MFSHNFKNAISPVIAVSLLLVVAVSSVVFFQTWFSDFSSSVFVDVESNSAQTSQGVGGVQVIGEKLYVKAGNNLNISKIEINGIDCNFNGTIFGIEKLHISTCLENVSGGAEIIVFTNDGIFESYDFIESKSFLSNSVPSIVCQNNTVENFYAGDGSLGSPFEICDCTQLQNMKYYLSGNFSLVSNVDCSNTNLWNGGLGFEPIGNNSNRFIGNFEGNDFTISNLFINRPLVDYVGLFGYSLDLTLKNLNVINVNIVGNQFVGTLSGYGYDSKLIDNVYVSGHLSSKGDYLGGLIGSNGWNEVSKLNNGEFVGSLNSSGSYIGGLLGFNTGVINNSKVISNLTLNTSWYVGGVAGASYHGDVFNSNSNVNIQTLNSGQVGGLLGYSDNNKVDNAYSIGVINNTGITTGHRVGGLIGAGYTANVNNSFTDMEIFVDGQWGTGGLLGTSSGDIYNSYSLGKVTGVADVGGLVGGTQRGVIVNSYSNVEVIGDSNVGGFIGSTLFNGGIVNNSYSIGSVTGNTFVGGFIGKNNSGVPIVENSYWDTVTSTQATSAFGIGQTTTELQSPISNTGIYSNWDLSNWDFGLSSEYPKLTWE